MPLCILICIGAWGHSLPNTSAQISMQNSKVVIRFKTPLDILELASKINVDLSTTESTNSIKQYYLKHIHACDTLQSNWQISVDTVYLHPATDKIIGKYDEVIAAVSLTPSDPKSVGNFQLICDLVIHQVINQSIIFSASQYAPGNDSDGKLEQAGIISSDPNTGKILPLKLHLSAASWFTTCKSMFMLGMRHIKEGTDHLLFIIVLLLPAMLLVQGKRWGGFGGTTYSIKRLLKIVTAFTAGHSLTLLAGATGWLQLPAQPVEILIAVSILISAIHAVRPVFPGKEVYVAAGFGLVHGLAFATVLSSLKLTPGALALSIVGFNAGIELMQLFIILLIVPWLILLSQTAWYGAVRVCGAVLAAIAAIAWIAERSTGSTNIIATLVANASRFGLAGILALAGVSVAVYALQTGKADKKLLV